MDTIYDLLDGIDSEVGVTNKMLPETTSAMTTERKTQYLENFFIPIVLTARKARCWGPGFPGLRAGHKDSWICGSHSD